MIVSSKGKDFDPVPAGFYPAVCYSILDLGSEINEKFNSVQRKVQITWEIPSLRIKIDKDGETKNLPRVIGKKYTASLSDKGYLRKDLESWRGKPFTEEELKGFDIKKLLGVTCQLQIQHKLVGDKTYANVTAVINKSADQQPLTPENPQVHYSIEEDRESLPELPEWLTDKIKASPEYKALSVPEGHQEPDDGSLNDIGDDIPF